jgi:hypothetical protein
MEHAIARGPTRQAVGSVCSNGSCTLRRTTSAIDSDLFDTSSTVGPSWNASSSLTGPKVSICRVSRRRIQQAASSRLAFADFIPPGATTVCNLRL